MREVEDDIQDYKSWRGKNRFFCWGHIMMGPPIGEDIAVWGAHGLLILGIISLSCTFAPYSFSHYVDTNFFPFLTVFGYLIGLWLWYWLIRCQFTDPGVLFREFSYEDEEAGFPSEKNIQKNEFEKQKNDIVRQGAHIYKPRYCNTCHIIRPPLASHCGACDNWVQEFDHHCTFVNNWIGRRNIKYFFGLLILSIIWAIYFNIIGMWYLFHYIYYYADHKKLLVVLPVTLAGIPSIFWIFNILWITKKKIIVAIAGMISLIAAYWYLIPFPELYINPLVILFFVIPNFVIFMLHGMAGEYICLLSRNITEKEKVSRKTYTSQNKLSDHLEKRPPLMKAIKNILTILTRKNPPSVLSIGRRMRKNMAVNDTDIQIRGMNDLSSSSSSSEDELPDFMKPKPLNIVYPNNPNVMIIGEGGRVIGSIPHEQFVRENNQKIIYLGANQDASTEEEVNVEGNGEGGFSDKYQQKLDKEKIDSVDKS